MGEDLSAADLVLPYLGSPAHPLTEIAAAHIGSTRLGVRELEQQLTGQPARLQREAGRRRQ
jgi:hypothetical protein